ncbi:hypothetical protein PAMP_013362 [Pampus punctatissimus]
MLFSVLLVLGICLVPAHSNTAGNYIDSSLLQHCFEKAKTIVDDAYKYSREESLRRVRREAVSPHDTLRLLKQPRGPTRLAVFVFRDYLPHIVGDDAMRRQLGRYPGYNPNVNPSIANVFATAAYRFAHLAIQPVLSRLDDNNTENRQFPSVPLFKAFFTPWRIIFEGGIDPLLRGLINRPAKLNTQDHMMVNALRERLFQFVMHMALDLGSLNMQRGRDHGLPGYNAWRRFCGLSQPRNVAELAQVLNNTNLARRLLELYGTPANIDVWMGGVAEPFVRGGRVGPLFSCLIATQFQRIRQGPAGPPGLRGPPGPPAVSINTTQPQSAFSVRLGQYSPSSNKIICFRQVIYNKQNHYSVQTGVFTCVIRGVYQFKFLCTSFTNAGSVNLWRNKKLVLRGFNVYKEGYFLSSGDMELRLESGDQVRLEVNNETSGLSPKSYFSGHLLFAE